MAVLGVMTGRRPLLPLLAVCVLPPVPGAMFVSSWDYAANLGNTVSGTGGPSKKKKKKKGREMPVSHRKSTSIKGKLL